MTGMHTSLQVLMRCVRTGRIVDRIRILALEILGEYRMDRAAMNMPLTPMRMVCLGMHVEEWNHEHPDGYPCKDEHARP